MPTPHELLFVDAEEFQLRAVRLEPEEALAEVQSLAADLARETGVADDRVDPVVQPVPQVRRPGVGVVRLEAGEQDLALVGLAVAVRVVEEQHVGGLRHDQAAVGVAERGGDAQVLGEDGLLVGPAVAVGVLDDRDPVATLPLRLHLVGVVDRLGHVEPAEVVPGHGDRLADLRLGDEQLRLEPVGHGQMLDATLRARAASASCGSARPACPSGRPACRAGSRPSRTRRA